MKLHKHKKIACTLITAASLLSLASCGGQSNTSEIKNNNNSSENIELGEKRPEPADIFRKFEHKNFSVMTKFKVLAAPEVSGKENSAVEPNFVNIVTDYTKDGFQHKYLGPVKTKNPDGYFEIDKDYQEHKKGVYKYELNTVVEKNEKGKEIKKTQLEVGDSLEGKTSLYDSFVTPYDLYKEADSFGKYFKKTNAFEVNRLSNATKEGEKYLVKLEKALNVYGILNQIKGVNVVCCDLKYSATSSRYAFRFFYQQSDKSTKEYIYSEAAKTSGKYFVAAEVSVSKLSTKDKPKVHLKELENYKKSLNPVSPKKTDEKGGK